MPFLRVQRMGDPVQQRSVIHPYPSKSHEIPLFLIPGILGNGIEYSNIIDQLQEIDGYTLILGYPENAENIQSNKIYLYVGSNGDLEYTGRNNQGQVESISIPKDDIDIQKYYSSIIETLQQPEKTLSPEQEKALYEVTSKRDFTPSARPIFIYSDQLVTPDKNRAYKECTSLQEQAKLVAECMVEGCLPVGPAPYLIIGYSYGCSLATLAAQQLKEKGLNVSLFLIDGPSPECSQQYFSGHSISLTRDLIKIIQYAAKLALPKSNDDLNLQIESSMIEKLCKLTALDQMDKIISIATDKYKAMDKEVFEKYTFIAKQGIYNLITHKVETPAPKIESAVTLVTKETEDKYKDSRGGWDNYITNLTVIDDEMRDCQHTNLLTQDSNTLATSIEHFINSQTNPSDLLEMHLRHLMKTFTRTVPYSIRSAPREEQILQTSSVSQSTITPPEPIDIYVKSGSMSEDESTTEQINSRSKIDPRKFAATLGEFQKHLLFSAQSSNPPTDTQSLQKRQAIPTLS